MLIATSCAALRPAPTAEITIRMTIADVGPALSRSAPAGEPALRSDVSVPIAVNTINAGTGSSRTASNSPATIAAATMATTAAFLDLNAIDMRARNSTTVAASPLSETNAIQSLLGHG